MHIFCFPGNSPSTYQWLVNLTDALDLQQSVVDIQRYSWWNDPEKDIDIPHETEAARSMQADLVIAKSLGTVIALEAFQEPPGNAVLSSLAPQSRCTPRNIRLFFVPMSILQTPS